MLAFVHRSGLTDDAAGAWLRYVLRALARLGHTVHAVCGETRPERFDFLSEVYAYEPDGSVATRLHRQTVHPGRIVLHTPLIRDATAPLTVDALFDALAAVVPGHGIEVMAALGGGAAGAAAHRASAAWGTPYAVVRRGEGRGDPAVIQDAVRVFEQATDTPRSADALGLPGGVDATAVHPLRRSARGEQIERLCERLRAHDPDDHAAEALQFIEAIDWGRSRVIVSRSSNPDHLELLQAAVDVLTPGAEDAPVVIAGPLPAALYPEWLPCADVFVAFDDGGPARRPGVLDAMAAGVIPVATPEAGAHTVSAALAQAGHTRAAAGLALARAERVDVGPLASAIRIALAEGEALKGALRQASVQQHDWHVVAAQLYAILEEVVDLGHPARAVG